VRHVPVLTLTPASTPAIHTTPTITNTHTNHTDHTTHPTSTTTLNFSILKVEFIKDVVLTGMNLT
jgi:hypothetical protein